MRTLSQKEEKSIEESIKVWNIIKPEWGVVILSRKDSKTRKREPVVSVSWVLAFISMAFVFPSPSYLQYIDWRVLGYLFALMLVAAGFRKMFVFTRFSGFLLRYAHTPRQVASLLVWITFFSSMGITNDVALIPLAPSLSWCFPFAMKRNPFS